MTDIWTPDGRYRQSVDGNRCRASVFDGYRSYQCSRKGRIEESGMLWCKQHLPSAVKAKQDARDAKMRKGWKRDELSRAAKTARGRIADVAITCADLDADLQEADWGLLHLAVDAWRKAVRDLEELE